MINSDILKSLETNFQDPSYSTVISDFNQEAFCNKDTVEIVIQQFNPNLEKIIENKEGIIERLKQLLTDNDIAIPGNLNEIKVNSCVEKKLKIESVLDVDKDGIFISRLNGSITNDKNVDILTRQTAGIIQDKRITIQSSDAPNYFNKSKIKLRGNQLIIEIPKIVDTFDFAITNLDTNATAHQTQNNVVDGKLTRSIHIENRYSFQIEYTIKDSLVLQDMESIVTPLASEVELRFQNTYSQLPSVIITIDENDKIYDSYETTFTKNRKREYNGVKINFKRLKRQKEYGDVNITIIGYKVSD